MLSLTIAALLASNPFSFAPRRCEQREREWPIVRRMVALRGGAAEVPAPVADFKSWWASKSKSFKIPEAVGKKDPARDKAAALMKQRGLERCEKAVSLLREAYKRDPDNVETAMELADALNAVMRIKTNANALVIEGSLDTPKNKKIWKVLGDEALPLATTAYKAKVCSTP